jgi:hypothetical protein
MLCLMPRKSPLSNGLLHPWALWPKSFGTGQTRVDRTLLTTAHICCH